MQPDLSQLGGREIGEVGRLLTTAEMMLNGFEVARPELDKGYDLVAIYNSHFTRIQVKTSVSGKTFAIRRCRRSADNRGRTSSRFYDDASFDAFVFASLVSRDFWIFPMSQMIALGYTSSKTMQSGDEHHNAWHLLKQ